MHVVVVEDHAAIRDLLGMSLDGVADVVAAFPSATAAQQWDGWDMVDVCVSDHMMPGMTGCDLLTWLAETHPGVLRVLTSVVQPADPCPVAQIFVDKGDLSAGLRELMIRLEDSDGR